MATPMDAPSVTNARPHEGQICPYEGRRFAVKMVR
jgi:hypothetical protein